MFRNKNRPMLGVAFAILIVLLIILFCAIAFISSLNRKSLKYKGYLLDNGFKLSDEGICEKKKYCYKKENTYIVLYSDMDEIDYERSYDGENDVFEDLAFIGKMLNFEELSVLGPKINEFFALIEDDSKYYGIEYNNYNFSIYDSRNYREDGSRKVSVNIGIRTNEDDTKLSRIHADLDLLNQDKQIDLLYDQLISNEDSINFKKYMIYKAKDLIESNIDSDDIYYRFQDKNYCTYNKVDKAYNKESYSMYISNDFDCYKRYDNDNITTTYPREYFIENYKSIINKDLDKLKEIFNVNIIMNYSDIAKEVENSFEVKEKSVDTVINAGDISITVWIDYGDNFNLSYVFGGVNE